MNKNQLLADLELQKQEKINLLKTNLSDDDRKAVVEAINSLDARINRQKELADSEVSEFQQSINALMKNVETMRAENDAIKDKLKENNIKVKGVSENYLESENSVRDFASAMREAISHKGDFRNNWAEKLHTNGITIAEGSEGGFYPTPVKSMIADKWKEYGKVLDYFYFTGAKAFWARYNGTSQDSTDVRAKGFKSGAGKTKSEQTLTLSAKLLESEFVYKMIAISNKTIWEDDTLLIDYVLTELLKQWNYEVLRAILIGDGRAAGSDDKITKIESIVRSATDVFATKYNTAQADGVSAMEFLMDNAILPLYNGEDDIVLFVGKADATAIRKRNNPTGADPIYRSLEDVAKEMGVKDIVVVPYLDSTTEDAPRAIAVHAKQYAIVGSLSPVFTSYEEFFKNDVYFRVEIPVGGGLQGLDSAVFVMNPAV